VLECSELSGSPLSCMHAIMHATFLSGASDKSNTQD
jgi:hypothetical protein